MWESRGCLNPGWGWGRNNKRLWSQEGILSLPAAAALCVILVPQGHQVQLAFWGSTIPGKLVLQYEGKG